MKQILLPLCTILLGISSFAQINNGSLERWMDNTLHTDPISEVEVSTSNSEIYYSLGIHNVYEVEGESSTAMRVENYANDDEVIPGYYIIGNEPNSEGESLVFGGGFDIQDPQINGINMDLRYNFPQGSEGFVLVQFKNDGVPVGTGNMADGTFIFYLDGSQEWENTTFSFPEGIDPSANQCVIGIASADLIGDDVPFAADAFVEVDNLSFVNSQDAIPASDFEEWDSVGEIPVPFFVEMEVNEENAFERSEDSFEGNFALKLMTKEINNETRVGEALFGRTVDGELTPNIELRSDFVSISFMYHFQAEGDETAQAVVTFFSEEEGDYTSIYSHTITLPANEGYELVDYNYLEDLEGQFQDAEYMSISFRSSSSPDELAQLGSELTLDLVSLNSTLSDFRSFFNPRELKTKAFPNPTTGIVRFDFGKNRSGFYRVFNSNGIQVGIRQYSSTRTVVHDLGNQPSGKYFFRFRHSDGISDVRVLKL